MALPTTSRAADDTAEVVANALLQAAEALISAAEGLKAR